MALTKKVDFKKMSNLIIKGTEKKLQKEAPNLEDGIRRRTRSGKDVNLKSFKPYSKAYARKKSGGVDLTDKDHMLPAITAKKIKGGLTFKFTTKSETDKAIWNQKTRYFFGIDKNQIKYLKKKLGKL